MKIETAKKLFFVCNCSKYVMAQTDSKYEEFVNMHISNNILEEWAYEYLDKCIYDLLDNTTWDNYYKISSLLVNYHNSMFIKKYINMLTKIENNKEFNDILICDDILGMRNISIKCGILDYAIECNDIESVKYMIHFVEGCLVEKKPSNYITKLEKKLQEYTQK